MEQARAQVAELKDIFGAEDFYIELMDHALEHNPSTIASLRELAEEFSLKVVATNDVHFLRPDEHEAHDVLICIGESCLILDENRKSYSDRSYCFEDTSCLCLCVC